MNNPFNSQPRPAYRENRNRQASFSFLMFLGALGATSLLLLGLWFARQADWLPEPLKGLVLPIGEDHQLFVANVDLSREKARGLYRQALDELNGSNYAEAITHFKQLEAVYPGMQDLLWLHEADAYAGQGNEWAVQKKLTALLDRYTHSPYKALSLYRIGQSQYRGSEWEAAKMTFEKVRRDFPDTDYALGSLYYLGALLARDESTHTEAVTPLKTYLSQCPDCKFSGDAADLLEQLLPQPSADEHALIGLGQVTTARDIQKTLNHLQKGTRHTTWLALGKAQIQAGKNKVGVQTLTDSIHYAKSLTEIRAAVDAMLAHTTGEDEKISLLKALNLKSLETGGDYVLWKLAQLDTDNSATHYRQLVGAYPTSDYAPESAWNLLWPLLANGQTSQYEQGAKQYLQHYPYAHSAPKALFWIAKIHENKNPSESTQLYSRILKQYPTDYYAFRAQGRLRELAEGKADPGWPTLKNREDYPPASTDWTALKIMPSAEKFGGGSRGRLLADTALELQAIGTGDDVRLLVSETIGALPPAVESWAAQVSGDRAKGLRVIRDGLAEQTKASFLASGNQDIQPQGTKDELKLLYPVYFSDSIAPTGKRNQLDPFLIQSLMREESYFNEFAISSSNARGLMQLLPSTAREVAQWEGLSNFQTNDLFLPAVNIRLGSRYLSHLHQLFNGNSMPAVGAYNGGPNAMKRWIQASSKFSSDPDMFVEKIPYEQSRDYIKKVFTSYWNYSRLYSNPSI